LIINRNRFALKPRKTLTIEQTKSKIFSSNIDLNLILFCVRVHVCVCIYHIRYNWSSGLIINRNRFTRKSRKTSMMEQTKFWIFIVIAIRDPSERTPRFWDRRTDNYLGSSDVDLGRKVEHRLLRTCYLYCCTSNNVVDTIPTPPSKDPATISWLRQSQMQPNLPNENSSLCVREVLVW